MPIPPALQHGSDTSSPATVPIRPIPMKYNSERRLVVVAHEDYPMIQAATQKKKRDKPSRRKKVVSFLDRFTSLCVCGVDTVEPEEEYDDGDADDDRLVGLKESVFRSERVVYPVENYEFPLNSKRLVDQRRQSLKHQLFRPVSEDENSVVAVYPRRARE